MTTEKKEKEDYFLNMVRKLFKIDKIFNCKSLYANIFLFRR